MLLSVGGLEYADTTYLGNIYQYIANLTPPGDPDDYFDAVAIHPYNWTGPIDIQGVTNIRQVMVDHTDSEKSIWLTEYGWNVNPNGGITVEQQAQYLLDSLGYLDSATYFYVTQASHHTISDWTTGANDLWMGLCDYDLNPRLAYNTFRDYAAPRTPTVQSHAPFVTYV